ncbi:Peroxidase [Thalictrum thalictroides]|uniref:Peroxidase n=1 Tax=Thalictrum thalictroides TaxID=46969 RepID=A0A7J6VSK0_THATH|nr:Peroxidase [Thalictrum thalictroides]
MAALLFALAILLLALQVHAAESLQFHFYQNTCPQAELVVKNIMAEEFKRDPSIPAGLLRLHFHDCIIRGCDALVLLDSRGENVAEKEAPPNLSLRGFEVIDKIKVELEKTCRGVVSCADILALATRDGVSLSAGSSYRLPTGRRDGTVSTMSDVHIPGPSRPLGFVLNVVQAIGLNLDDLTTLLGAHAIGFCHCGFFIDRLYNFKGTGCADPDLDQSVFKFLTKKCPRPVTEIFNISKDPTVFMTPTSNTPFKLDSSFYRGLLNGEAVLQLDQGLAFTDVTQKLATKYVQQPNIFRREFSKAMIKLGNVGVLTGQQGQVRLNCRRVNRRKQ